MLSDSVSIPVIATLHDCANTGRLVLHLPGSCLAQMTADTEKSCQNEKKINLRGLCFRTDSVLLRSLHLLAGDPLHSASSPRCR